MCTIRVRVLVEAFFSRSLVRKRVVRCGDVRLQGEFDTGRFVEFFSAPSSYPSSERNVDGKMDIVIAILVS